MSTHTEVRQLMTCQSLFIPCIYFLHADIRGLRPLGFMSHKYDKCIMLHLVHTYRLHKLALDKQTHVGTHTVILIKKTTLTA